MYHSSKKSCSLEVSFSSHTLSRVNNNNLACMIRVTLLPFKFQVIWDEEGTDRQTDCVHSPQTHDPSLALYIWRRLGSLTTCGSTSRESHTFPCLISPAPHCNTQTNKPHWNSYKWTLLVCFVSSKSKYVVAGASFWYHRQLKTLPFFHITSDEGERKKGFRVC